MSRLEAMLKALSIERVQNGDSEDTDAHDAPDAQFAVAPRDLPELTPGIVSNRQTVAPGGIELTDDDDGESSPDRETAVESGPAADGAAPREPAVRGHFTTLDQERESEEEYAATEPDRNWWTILAGAVALAAIIFALWYAFRPASADKLYERIAAAAEEGDEKLAMVENDIQDFLNRFPNDERHNEVDNYQEDVQLYRLQRRLERRVRQRGSSDGLLPVEQNYLDAIRLVTTEPEVAAARLSALIDVYQDAEDDERTTLCVALAQRQLARLKQDLEETSKQHLEELNRRLEHADAIAEDNPSAAEAIWRGIILLYADKPWAARSGKQSSKPCSTSRNTHLNSRVPRLHLFSAAAGRVE